VRLYGVRDAGGVDGVLVVVDGGTRVDRDASHGALVEVRATVLSDGTLRATRIRARKDED
jgi:hypothetical protein